MSPMQNMQMQMLINNHGFMNLQPVTHNADYKGVAHKSCYSGTTSKGHP